ncbi:MAG: hypothetical protein EU533_05105 [Promethearchaeota archaeon]|nr:MAG: hypothetical protein EU533_05105 [Candidatus Lokiarchaeota archaeon]
MTDFHTKTFYGNKTSVSVSSPSKDIPYIFLSCFNRKEDGSWEKINEGEGKTVRLSIEEIICILEVLNKKSAIWRGFHIYKDSRTQIQVGWLDESRELLIIQIGSYKKKLRFPNINFLKMLMDHLLIEKIEFATTIPIKSKENGKSFTELEEYSLFTENITSRDGLRVVETTEYSPKVDMKEISAKIKAESPKALLISFDEQEFWVPKSTIHSGFDVNNKETVQKFIIDQWIVERNRKIES